VQLGHVTVWIQVFGCNARKYTEHSDLGVKFVRRVFGLLKQHFQVSFDPVEDVGFVRERVAVNLHVELREFGSEQRVAGGVDNFNIITARVTDGVRQAEFQFITEITAAVVKCPFCKQ